MATFYDELKARAEDLLLSCIGCGNCMKICPVQESKSISIKNINTATEAPAGTILPGSIIEFTHKCFQCGLCNDVCPANAHREEMMLFLKSKLQDTLPKEYKAALALKGKNIGFMNNIKQRFAKDKNILGELAQFYNNSNLKECDTLFYFGCYMLSNTGVQHNTITIANRLGIEYEMLGGLKYCCGMPHYYAGQIDKAEEMHRDLLEAIQKVKPKFVITSCAECYEALKNLTRKMNADFKVMTTSEWVLRNIDKLQLKKLNEKVIFHDSCRFKRKDEHMREYGREVVRKVADLAEFSDAKIANLCCGTLRCGHDSEALFDLRTKKMQAVKDASKMCVECVHCWESFAEAAMQQAVGLTDVTSLVVDALAEKSKEAAKPEEAKPAEIFEGEK